MSQVHRSAAAGYEAGAEVYEQARPEYHPAATQLALEQLELRLGKTVLDLAAGTGKWTRLMTPTGATVVAVEPVAAMRQQLRAAVPDAQLIAGTAEAIPIGTASVDAASVASAIHWFRFDEAMAELHRVLRPNGRLASIRNNKDTDVPWVAEYDAILDPYVGDTPRTRNVPLSDSPLFTNIERRTFPHAQPADADWLVARTLSVSFIAALPPDDQETVVERVREMAVRLPSEFDFPYVTEVQWGQRRGG